MKRPRPSWASYPAFLALVLVLQPAPSGAAELRLHPQVRLLRFDLLGPFVHAADGKIVAIDTKGTWASGDEGKTWSERRPFFSDARNKEIKVSKERAFLRTRDGTLIAAYMNTQERHFPWSDELHDAPGARLPTYAMRSTDGGASWVDVQKLHDDWTGAIRDMIQTRGGRIVFTSMKLLHDPGRHSVMTYSSADDGVTWEASNIIDMGGRGHHGGVSEATLVELRDGRLWMLFRTNRGQFWSAHSTDGGLQWKNLQPSGIPASSAPGMLSRLASGRLMLLWNRPHPEGRDSWSLTGGDGIWSETPASNYRNELSLAFSEDDGESWTGAVVVAGQDGAALSYPYVFEVEPGHVWLTTMQGDLRLEFKEDDLFRAASESEFSTVLADGQE